MGLLSTEVEVTLQGKNIPYYENLGYEIPRYFNKANNREMVKRGTKIKIKVKDLMPQSMVKVDVDCDCCKKEYTMPYMNYYNQNHDGKIYCNHCAPTILISGENNWHWDFDKTDEERENGRNYPEYTEFVKGVMARDKYICQCCGKPATDVHHLYGYAGFPKYRTDQTQAVSLCSTCHSAFHKWHREQYGYKNKGNCTRNDFEVWLGYALKELNKYEGELSTCSDIICLETQEIKTMYEFMKEYGYNNHTGIYACCNKRFRSYDGKHFLYYSEYKNMTEKDLKEYFDWCNEITNKRKIICLTTLIIYKDAVDAAESFGNRRNNTHILKCCKGKAKSAGKLPDGTPLHWMFYEDFLKLPKEEQNEILARNQESSSNGSFIM